VTLLAAPRIAWQLGLLMLPLLLLPWLGLGIGVLNGLRDDASSTPVAIAEVADSLLLAAAVSAVIAIEVFSFACGSLLVLPATLLAQTAGAAADEDFRHPPARCGAAELGSLAVAFRRLVRHLARRRGELDWLAADVARHGVLPGRPPVAAPLSPLTAAGGFAADDGETLETWLPAPEHRLLAVFAGAITILAGATLPPVWWPAVAAAALLGGRLTEPLRRLGAPCILLGVVAALGLLWIAEPAGGLARLAALGAALAAGIAVHCGGGWRGPTGTAADTSWQRGGLAGAVSGAAAAAALLGLLDAATIASVVLPGLLVTLGIGSICVAPERAVATPGDWLGAQAALRLLRSAAARRRMIGGALPAGLALGATAGLALGAATGLAPAAITGPTTGTPSAILAPLLALVLLALPPLGWRGLAAPRPLAAAALLGLAAAATIGFATILPGALLATAGAVLAWPDPGGEAGLGAPRQSAILAAMLRAVGVVAGLALAALLPAGLSAGLPVGLAGLALLIGALPAALSPQAARPQPLKRLPPAARH